MVGVGGFRNRGFRGHTPGRSRSGLLEAADQAAEQIGFGAGRGECDAHPRGGFGNPCGDHARPMQPETSGPSRRARTLLAEFLPLGKPQTVETTRPRTLRVATRLEQEAVAGAGCKPAGGDKIDCTLH
jgi:hypothetical protein